ncbi:MFS general substrate transporter [Fistulina hepatica ATCC 64428]|uniref:MFS general substrate transporter n=1 Tax=Fistulina hepatica ATCC 64428 TaxID=1128425 RepID=A0A0D7A4Y3_9AGAR|nr:MFS general substrate transporter [Fistulina hepatica ATCC 64428]
MVFTESDRRNEKVSTVACTNEELLEGLTVRPLQRIHQAIDPRIPVTSHVPTEELDEGLIRQLSNLGRRSPTTAVDAEKQGESTVLEDKSVLYLDFDVGDQRDPTNFSRQRKWIITYTACFFTLISGAIASSYNMGFSSMINDLRATTMQATVGLTLYALGFALAPLVTASFSEEFGRQPLYVGSVIIFSLMNLMIALSKNIGTVQAARFIQGACGSTGSTMVGGTVADIWAPAERGVPMSMFGLAALAGTGLGPVAAGFIEMNSSLQWRWIQWIQLIICGIYVLLVPILMKETRSTIILTRLARKVRRNTGDNRYRARVEDERASLWKLVRISCTRPIHLMVTEPIVLSFSIWIGFAWGVVYCLVESIDGTFSNLHGFNISQVGVVFSTLAIGSSLAFGANFFQEKLYRRFHPTRGVEARLCSVLVAAVLLPGSMFLYAWTAFPSVSWVAQAIGLVLFSGSTFVIYLAVFSYLADCYGPFASSALAGQSLARNVMGAIFPLFTRQMFDRLGYRWAATLIAGIATVMIPIPYILFYKGPKIRSRSKFSRLVMEAGKL